MKIMRNDGTLIGDYKSVADAVQQGANLIEANLIEANLSGANLRGANLGGANLSEANLREVQWNSAILANAIGAPWHFGLGRHVAIVHEGKIYIGCKIETIEWWLEHYRATGRAEGYSDAEIAEYGAWIEFVAQRLAADLKKLSR